MKTTITIVLSVFLLGSCTTTDGPRVKRDRMRDCPTGMVQICKSRTQREPSSGGDEEIPEYDYCYCETGFN